MRNHHPIRYICRISLLLLIPALLGCRAEAAQPTQSAELAEPVDVEPTIAEPTALPTVSPQVDYWVAWESSSHAQTYSLEKGAYDDCARCHSPENWNTAVTTDPPIDCTSSDFSSESAVSPAPANVPISEDEWQDIGCEVCHRMEEGVADSEILWLNMRTNNYETVTSATVLCEKCHADSETWQHGRHISDSVHADFTCTDCHDAHTTAASCTSAGCHTDFTTRYPELIPEHTDQVDDQECTECHSSVADIHMNKLDETPVACLDCHEFQMGEYAQVRYQAAHSNIHTTVTCIACHDGSELEAGPMPDTEQWITFRTTSLLGQATTAPYQSHNVQNDVNCIRCHYLNNPWELPLDIEELPNENNAG